MAHGPGPLNPDDATRLPESLRSLTGVVVS